MPQESAPTIDSGPSAVVAVAAAGAQILQDDRRVEIVTLLTWLIIAAGIGLRIVDFLNNRSLWGDEAAVANNIVDRTFPDLLLPLAHKQAAAPLFLWAEKCASLAFGLSEYAFRLVPLTCGILSVILFALVCARYLSKWQTLLATTLFALGDPLIRYSSEVKQYSSDVFFVLLIYWSSSKFFREKTLESSLLLAAVGAVSLWFSYPASFVLAALNATLLAMSLEHRKRLSLTVVPILVWSAVMIELVLVHLAALSVNRPLLELYGRSAFPPTSPHGWIPWLGKLWHEFTSRSLGISGDGIADICAFFLASLGAISLSRKSAREFWSLALPTFITLAASSLHCYPLVGRLLLFLVPAWLIFIARAINARLHPLFKLASVFMVIAVLWHPVSLRVKVLGIPRTKQEVRPAFDYLLRHWHAGDTLYVHYLSRMCFQFYRDLNNWQEPNVVLGSEHRREPRLYAEELERFRGRRRVWILMSANDRLMVNNQLEKDYIVQTLNGWGKLKDWQAYVGTELFLFDLTSNASKETSQPRPPQRAPADP